MLCGYKDELGDRKCLPSGEIIGTKVGTQICTAEFTHKQRAQPSLPRGCSGQSLDSVEPMEKQCEEIHSNEGNREGFLKEAFE